MDVCMCVCVCVCVCVSTHTARSHPGRAAHVPIQMSSCTLQVTCPAAQTCPRRQDGRSVERHGCVSVRCGVTSAYRGEPACETDIPCCRCEVYTHTDAHTHTRTHTHIHILLFSKALVLYAHTQVHADRQVRTSEHAVYGVRAVLTGAHSVTLCESSHAALCVYVTGCDTLRRASSVRVGMCM